MVSWSVGRVGNWSVGLSGMKGMKGVNGLLGMMGV